MLLGMSLVSFWVLWPIKLNILNNKDSLKFNKNIRIMVKHPLLKIAPGNIG